MENRILHIELRDHSLVPAAAEIRIIVRAAHLSDSTELRGRLMGPTCRFASTVEVAYSVRALPREDDALQARVVIPEGSFWDPQSPFLYTGPIELWEEGKLQDTVRIVHGLRRLDIGKSGLQVNGRRFALQGTTRISSCTEQEALALRMAGYNLFVAPVEEQTMPLWDLGDRRGFLVLGRVDGEPGTLERAHALSRHPSCLGWLIGAAEIVPKLARGWIGFDGPLPAHSPSSELISFLVLPQTDITTDVRLPVFSIATDSTQPSTSTGVTILGSILP